MTRIQSGEADTPGLSICLYCGSSDTARPEYLQAADQFGRRLAAEGVRLVYGGGGIGLMGAAARAAHAEGGRVLGVIPQFLRRHEVVYDEVETVVVANMHERKMRMFEAADGFAIFPGGIGTLEEVIELMSWRRLGLHSKPMVFLNMHGFWEPLFALMRHTIAETLTPAWLPDTWAVVETVDAVLPALLKQRAAADGAGLGGDQSSEVTARG